MAVGWGNPQDNSNSAATRPPHVNTAAGVRKWHQAGQKWQFLDINAILGSLRYIVDQNTIADVEGDDTIVWQAIKKYADAKVTALSLGTMSTQNANAVTITGGTITGIADLGIASGGTSAHNAPGARTNLGLEIGTDVQAQNARLQDIADNLTATVGAVEKLTNTTFGTYTVTAYAKTFLDDINAPAVRTTLGLGTIATQNSNDVTITGGAITGITDIALADGGTGASNPGGARANLGLGNVATQDAADVTITGGTITGITDITIADGGTGASSAGGARANLGLGTMATQNAADVTILGGTITGITDIALADGGTGASNAGGARTNLGLGTMATQNAADVTILGGSVVGITDIAIADGGTGASNASGARANLGLGTIATQNSNGVAITGGAITGITDIALADGGTGASNAGGARANLGLGTMATQDATSVNITGGNATNIYLQLLTYTVATLPSPSPARQIVFVSNGVGNKHLAISDNSNWRFPDGAVVS